MHGRLKVKTSAQEQEEKRKEREKKLKIYRAGFDTVLKKRKNGEYDEEVLQITEQLLCANPDVYTFWNVRREYIELSHETKSADEYNKILEGELRVTESALRPNPKSYGAWHHRMWVLESMKDPPLARELLLCSKLLKADPRNFHCWDYRRWLSLSLGSGKKNETELDFSFEKLSENFSNYSAWHYRTLLLPLLHPDRNSPCAITAKQYQKELEIVQNAVFTDPADQSAWFYLRWLLGNINTSEPQLRIGLLQFSNDQVISGMLALRTAEKPGALNEDDSGLFAQIRIGDEVIKGHWECSGSLKRSHTWIFVPDPAGDKITISAEQGNSKNCEDKRPSIILTRNGKECDVLFLEKESNGEDEWWLSTRGDKDEAIVWGGTEKNLGKGLATSLLEEQLELCTQLLDMEPDSRWTLLTAVQLLRALQRKQSQPNMAYHSKIMEYLDKLKKVDPLRSGFYSDLCSDCVLDSALHSTSRVQPSSLDLSSLGLTTLPSPSVPLPLPFLLAIKIDLSGNPSLSLPGLRSGALLCLVHLPRLRHLCLATDYGNLVNAKSLKDIIPKLPQLLCLELVPNEAGTAAPLPQVIVQTMYELMPALQKLKSV